MKNNCQGPCLSHCFKEEKFIYLVIGFILGVVIYEIINIISSAIALGFAFIFINRQNSFIYFQF